MHKTVGYESWCPKLYIAIYFWSTIHFYMMIRGPRSSFLFLIEYKYSYFFHRVHYFTYLIIFYNNFQSTVW